MMKKVSPWLMLKQESGVGPQGVVLGQSLHDTVTGNETDGARIFSGVALVRIKPRGCASLTTRPCASELSTEECGAQCWQQE